MVARSEGGRQGGEARQRGKRRQRITRVEAREFGSGCRGGADRCLSVTNGASAGGARQQRGWRFEDAGAGPGLLQVAWAKREGRGSPSESRGRRCLIHRQGDSAASSVAGVPASSPFAESVQQLGQGGGGRGATGTSGSPSASLRALVIRVHTRTLEGEKRHCICHKSPCHIL